MKKIFTKILVSALAVTSLLTFSSCSNGTQNSIQMSASPTPEPGPFVDKYVFEDLLDKTVSYDLNGDGNEDTIKLERIGLYSEQMGDYCARYYFIINDEKYHIEDFRHGAYERVYITDLDPTDTYLDILMFFSYKGISVDIFRFTGDDIFQLQQPTYDNTTLPLYAIASTCRDYENLDELIDNIDIKVPESPNDKNEFTITCGNESFTYKKVSDGVYEEK